MFGLVQGPQSGWSSATVIATMAAGVVSLAAFFIIESRVTDPIMPLSLFRNRNLSAGFATTFGFMASFGTLLSFLTMYYQDVHGYSALQAAGSNAGGRIMTKAGPRTTIMASLVLGAAGVLLLGLEMSVHGSYAGPILLSLGQGIIYTAMFAASGTGIPAAQQGIASGVVSTGQQVGGAFGLAILVAIANAGHAGRTGQALLTATTSGIKVAVFITAAAVIALVAVAAWFRRGARRHLAACFRR